MHSDMENLINDLTTSCTPSPQEKKVLLNVTNMIENKIKLYISVNQLDNLVKDVVIGGSFAKGTWLKDENDIDIFIKFDPDVSTLEFEKYGKQIGIQSLKEYSPYLRYADHPYVELFVESVKFNIVPCFDVPKGKWKSAADRSPFHTLFVIDHLNEYKKNQVRILKKFLKSLGVYGAEISTEGFSGYVSEVLIIKFGSFLSALQYFSNYSIENNVININDNKKPNRTFDSFIVILDPVDENRNLGSAISPNSVATLIQASRKFLLEPRITYFQNRQKKSLTDKHIVDSLLSHVLLIEFKYSNRPSDVIWGQIKKTTNTISRFIKSYGFEILKNDCSLYEKEMICIVAFLMKSVTISKLSDKTGPEIFRHKDLDRFLESNKSSPLKWLDKDSRVKCLLFKEHLNVVNYLEFIIKTKSDLIGITKGLKNDFFNTVQVYLADHKPDDNNEQIRNNAVCKLLYTDDRLF